MVNSPKGDIIIISIYTFNSRAFKYMKQKLTELQGEIDTAAVIAGGINTPLSIMCTLRRQKVGKDIEDFNNNGERVNGFLLRSPSRQECLLLSLPLSIVLDVLASAIR